jgi:hypothetical protein
LRLAPGKPLDRPVEQIADAQDCGQLFDGLLFLQSPQAVGDVVAHVVMRKQRGLLEDQAHPAPLRRHAGYVFPADDHRSRVRPKQARQRL